MSLVDCNSGLESDKVFMDWSMFWNRDWEVERIWGVGIWFGWFRVGRRLERLLVVSLLYICSSFVIISVIF